jgi:hypothetical protein
MITRHLARAAVASAAALGLGVTALDAPARAATVDDDNVLITGTDVDFGSIAVNPGPLAMGVWQPGGSGQVHWDDDGVDITPHLTGYLWTEHLLGTCAKIRIQYYADGGNGSYVHLATRGSPEHCPTTDSIEWTEIDMAPYSDPDIIRVVVSTTVQNASGQFTIWGSQGLNLGD